MLANFTSCYLLSSATALFPAVLLAVAWIWLMIMQYEDILHDRLYSYPTYDPLLISYYTSIVLGALAGMWVFIALTRRAPALRVRVLPCCCSVRFR